MKGWFTPAGLVAILFVSWIASNTAQAHPRKLYTHLVWSDEFDGPNGSRPDPKWWTAQLGGNGWGNGEIETYTDRADNSFIQDGNLVIRAQKETFQGDDGIVRPYTSARLTTNHTFAQAYGRFEARIKIPSGAGTWPAFWMMGDDHDDVHWPFCGEIDIMEIIGPDPGVLHGSLHSTTLPGVPQGEASMTETYTLPSGNFSTDFHVYAIEWDPDSVDFYVDEIRYAHFTREEFVAREGKWVFDHPFFFILNVAVGGPQSWPGVPAADDPNPHDMLVDYVRVYE